MLRSRLLLAVIGASLPATLALGDDLTPPPWRYGPDTTFQHWDFSSGAGGGAPDGAAPFNPYGTPILTPSDPANFLPSFDPRKDVWAVNDFDPLHFFIPNDNEPENHKELWLQVTFLSPAVLHMGIAVSAPSGVFTLASSQLTQLPDGWIHELAIYTIDGCPEYETIDLTPPILGTTVFVDQVVVDTRCFPVPAPAAATPMLAALLATRRRRG